MNALNNQKVIAMDGPSGSGKSTMAKSLAKELNVLYIDTGAMYRALAYAADQKGIEFREGEELTNFLKSISIEYGASEEKLIVIDGQNLSQTIRNHEVSTLASKFSQLPQVRDFLVNFQRKLAESSICVMEGRDISTVVFPKAFCKIFVTASPEVRARRRLDQLIEKGSSQGLTFEKVLADVVERDRVDTEREVAPLKVAEDAIVLDTSDMNPMEVLSGLKEIALRKAQESHIQL